MAASYRQWAVEAARKREFGLESQRMGRYFTVCIEAPRGQNFGGLHEITVSYPDGAEAAWRDALKEINDAVPSPCDAYNCGGWVDGACDWWSSHD